MFAYALIFIVLLPITFLSSAIETIFSPEDLIEMGIRLESQPAEEMR